MVDTDTNGERHKKFLTKTNLVYEELRDEIANGQWEPGARISELYLTNRFEVSRTPIREVVVRLAQDGLVRREGTAIYVCERSPDEVLDIYTVRVFIESAIARSAALRRTESDLIRLEAAAMRYSAGEGSDPMVLQQLNRDFHDALAIAAHNTPLVEIQQRLTRQVARLPSTTLSYPGRFEASSRDHHEIVEAVRARDADAAERIGRQHMQAASDIRMRLMVQEFTEGPGK